MVEKTHESHRLLRFLLKRSGGDFEAASEAVQEAYLAATKSFRTFRHKSSYFTWLCRIALNKLADYYRDQINKESKIIVPAVEIFNNIFDPGLSHEEKLATDELKSCLAKCLNQLPVKYRQLLQLKYYTELTNSQICLKLNVSERSLEGKLYRAKKYLRKIFVQVEPELAREYKK